jgi:YegS/Rv2252/BmrU family lipid kinase
LAEAGIEVEQALRTRHVGALVRFAEDAVRQNVPLLVTGGGDGTQSAVATALQGHETIQGVLPLGTGNAFARDLEIPASVPEAVEILGRGNVRAVDVGVLGDATFLNVATIGISTAIAASLDPQLKRTLGRASYFFAALRAARYVRPFMAELETDNGRDMFEAIQLVIGNGQYHAGPFPISPEASLHEGRLSVYALRQASPATVLRFLLRLRSGTHGELAEVHAEECTWGRLVTEPAMRVTVDGEGRERTPATFTVNPASLRVLVP